MKESVYYAYISSLRILQKLIDGFEINKIIAAIVLTVVIVIGINKLADVVYNVKAPQSTTYKVATVTETKETSQDNETAKTKNVDINALMALGSIDHGKTVFRQCAACHSISKDGGNKIGPALFGVIGRKDPTTTSHSVPSAIIEYQHSATWM